MPRLALLAAFALLTAFAVLAASGPLRAEDAALSSERPSGSMEVPGGTVVLPPGPLPPEDLISHDARVKRIGLLLGRVEVLDTFAARFARQGRRLLDGRSVDCGAIGAIDHALRLTVRTSGIALRTVDAELALLPDFDALTESRERSAVASVRADEVEGRLWPLLRTEFEQQCPDQQVAPPTPWLPEQDRTLVDGSSVVFVRSARPDAVIWLDGAPAGTVDVARWAVLVTPNRSVRLCEAEPNQDECGQLVEVDPSPAAAFDLGA